MITDRATSDRDVIRMVMPEQMQCGATAIDSGATAL
jgi:hypothetical protein